MPGTLFISPALAARKFLAWVRLFLANGSEAAMDAWPCIRTGTRRSTGSTLLRSRRHNQGQLSNDRSGSSGQRWTSRLILITSGWGSRAKISRRTTTGCWGWTCSRRDPDVIEHAADQRMSHVRSQVAGKHVRQSQQLLNEIAAARVCLLHPEQKAAYDAQLQSADRGKACGNRRRARHGSRRSSPLTNDRHTWSQRAGPAWMGWGLGAAAAAALLVLGFDVLNAQPAAVPPGEPIARAPSPPPPRPSPPDKRQIAPAAEGAGADHCEPGSQDAERNASGKGEKSIEEALGMLTDKFALCQTLPLEEFVPTVEALRRRVIGRFMRHPTPRTKRL